MNSHSCRVGLFGVYSAKNFGDDLMGFIFGKALQGLGATFTLYAPGPESGRYGFPVASSVSQLVESSDLIVYGGGGILQPKKNDRFLGKELDTLLQLCRRHSVPIYCLSIGGMGLALSEIIPPARRQLVEQAAYVTLRLRADLPLLGDAGTMGTHHEDVVWTTPSFFPPVPIEKSGRKRTRIGINLYPHSGRERRLLPRIFQILTAVRRDCDFVFLESMFGDEAVYGDYQAYRPEKMRSNCSYYKFQSVEDGIECTQSFDLVITNRLHLGIVAMSYGIPSITLFPLPKTRLCYRELGLDRLCWDRKHIWKIGYLLTPQSQGWLLHTYQQFNLEQVRENASLHLRKLEEILQQCTGKVSVV